jgi:peptide/nickel transport system substrate-binding protein
VALGLLSLSGFLAACGNGRHGEPVRVVMENTPRTLDPHHHNEVVIWSVLCNVCEGLVRFSQDMRLEPALATSWEQIGPTTVRFHLRTGVAFHDGTPLTAGDVVASFERARNDPRSGIRHQLVGILKMSAPDPATVLVKTDGPAPTLINRLAFLFIVPAAQAAEEDISAPIGTGPYRFVARDADGGVRLAAYDGWNGEPEVRSVVFSGVTDDADRARALFAGQADVVRRMPEAELQDVRLYRGIRTEVQPGISVRIIVTCPQAAHGPARRALADPRVRRAMLCALDRRGIVDRVFRGDGVVATQYVHPVIFGFDPTIGAVPFDPGRARELLAEAGFADGFEVELAHGQLAPEAVEPIIDDLARVGIRVTDRPLPFSDLIQHASEHPLLYYGRSCTTGDASEFLDPLLHTRDAARGYGAENWGGYSNPQVDALIEEAGRELDRGRRLDLLHRAQRLALEDMPILPLAIRWSTLGLSGRIEVPTRYDEWFWVAGFHFKR